MEAWEQAVNDRDVKSLCRVLFDKHPTTTQAEIIRTIAYAEHKRVIINAMTRFGKTWSVALGVGLYILFHKEKKIYLISATDSQAGILRNYLADILFTCPLLRALAEHHGSGVERLMDEFSRKRLTFGNGCELITISAEGEANRLLGHGGDLVIVDESCQIKAEVYRAKISRMLGDSADSALVELSNPFRTDNHYYQHWQNPRFKQIHIGYEQAINEGRVTKEFIEEQRAELLPVEFRILYESAFPGQAEDSLYDLDALRACMEQELQVETRDVIISCDVADKGMDETVIFKAVTDGHQYKVIEYYHESKTEQAHLAGRLLALQQKPPAATRIFIDEIGYGAGVLSVVKEGVPKTCKVQGCHFGQRPRDAKRFASRKAEEYFHNAILVREKRLQLPREEKLLRDAAGVKWHYNSSSKIVTEDPEKSPDYCFIAGTKVLMVDDTMNIEDVRRGMMVMTPGGARKVLAVSCRLVDELLACVTSDNRVLMATGNHKIYTNQRFKYLKDMTSVDRLETSTHRWQKNIFSTKKENISKQEDIITMTSTMAKEKRPVKKKLCTEKSGKTNISKKSLLVMKCIISMATLRTIKSRISLSRRSVNTETIMQKSNSRTSNERERSFRADKKAPKHGIVPPKEDVGIRNIITFLSPKQNFTKECVMNVMKNMRRPGKKLSDSAPETAIWPSTGRKDGTPWEKIVCIAGKVLSHISSPKPVFVQKDVLRFPGGVKVYNLTIEDEHVYYADGVLVANCDALVYLTWSTASFAWGL